MRAARPQIGEQRGVIVDKTKAIVGKLAQRRFEPVDRLDVLLAKAPVPFDRIGQARIAEDHGDVGEQRGAVRQPARSARRLAGHEQPVGHHAQILVAVRIRRQQRMKADIGEPGAGQQRFEALLRIEPLGIKLVGDNAALGMHDDLSADQPVAIPGEVALAADEMVLVDPLPGTRLEMMAHPVAIHQIHDERAAGGEGAVDRFEHGEIVLGTLEIAEGVPQDADAVKVTVAEPKPPRIALVKRDLQVALLGALAGQADQVARAIEPGDIGKASAGELE